jgi:tetratricopeptide (TPR) repeat protein
VQKKQLFLIIGAVILFIALYFFGNMIGSKKTDLNGPTSEHQHQAGEGGPTSGMNPSAQIVDLDFTKYTNDAIANLSDENKIKANNLTQSATKSNTALDYKDIAEFWEAQKDLNMAANYYKKGAFLENTEKSVTFAGNLFVALLQKTEEPSIRKWQAVEAISCFEKAIELNPTNIDTKIALATCYTEGTGETMKGVTLLREITQNDSTNIPANIILGKLAIQSGQFDKAKKRLELVLSLRPDNTEAMYFLAEAYKGLGDKQKAIELFEKCKVLVKNPDFTKEIDNYIKTFK